MLVGLMPAMGQVAYAAGGTGKAVQLVESSVAANIAGGQESIVYFGNYNQGVISLSPKTFSVDPIKWRVLENESGNLFLLSDRILDQSEYNPVNKEITWEKSSIRSWLNGYDLSENDSAQDYTNYSFKKDAFTNVEYKTIATTTVTNDTSNDTQDKIFLLSIEEVTKTAYGFSSSYSNDGNRIATNTPYVAAGGRLNHPGTLGSDQPDCWWLRSLGSSSDRALFVSPNGSINGTGSEVNLISVFVRPALNLDLTNVIFTSAAVDGKKGNEALTAVDNYIGSEWKLTVLDSDRNTFNASFESKSGNLVTVNYTGATTGTNEYISAIIKNSEGTVTYYGRLAEVSSEAGTVNIDVGEKLNEGDTLYVFNEQYNGDYKTDYTSELKEITILAANTVKCTNYWGTSSDDAMTDVKVNGNALTSNPSGTPVNLTTGETATITLKNTSGWTNTTFGLFYNSAFNGSYSLMDNGSGVLSGSFIVPDVDFAIGINQTAVSTKGLEGIAISTQPTKTTYTEGETFDPAGMVVKATYSNGDIAEVTGYTFEPSGALTTSDTNVTVSYTEDGITMTSTQAITVNAVSTPTAPAITTSTLPNGKVGTAYDQTLAATGDATITWTLDSGNLPDGLLLGTDGKISGTPTTAGDYTFTVEATNGAGSDTRSFTITIAPADAVTYTVMVTNDGNGTGTASPTSGTTGTEVTLTASPNSGYKFKEWQVVSGGVTVSGDKFKIGTANVEIKAIFEKKSEPAPEPTPGPEPKPEPKPTPAAEYHHEHNYVWQITRKATPTVDGEMVYACKECGAVAQRLPISGYPAFNEDAANKIKNAKTGAEVVISTQKWISFYSIVWNELAKRPDVKLVIDYQDKGKMYEVVIPAGTDVKTLMNNEGYAGFLFLSGKFGRHEIKVY